MTRNCKLRGQTMTGVSKQIVALYMMRNSKTEKEEFLKYIIPQLNRIGYDTRIQATQSSGKSNYNLIAGDLENAHIIFTAHYDTPRQNIFYNRVYPTSVFKTWLVRLLPVLILLVLTAFIIINNSLFSGLATLLIGALLIGAGTASLKNKNNYNDNTSGVVCIYDIAARISPVYKDKAAFVFFDNEENGFKGSKAFAEEFGELCKKKLIINLDCLGSGDDIAFCYSDTTHDKAAEIAGFYKNSHDNKRVGIIKLKPHTFVSDFKSFENWINVSVFHRTDFGNLYLNNIHSADDIVIDEENLDIIGDIMFELVSQLFFF